jgi:hypothetical protein
MADKHAISIPPDPLSQVLGLVRQAKDSLTPLTPSERYAMNAPKADFDFPSIKFDFPSIKFDSPRIKFDSPRIKIGSLGSYCISATSSHYD